MTTQPLRRASPTGATWEPLSGEELRLDWHEAYSGDFLEAGNQRILNGVPTTPTGFLVFGYTALPRAIPGPPEDQQLAVWTGSPDAGWNPVESSSFEGDGNQRATDAVVFRDGTVVLVGTDESNGDFDAAAWRLPSGSSVWQVEDEQGSALTKPQDQKIRDAVRSGMQLYAVGIAEDAHDQDIALWQSRLGIRWTFQQGSAPSESGLQQMTGIVLSPDGFLVAGGSIEEDGDQDAAVWKWKPEAPFIHRVHDDSLGGPGAQQINAIVVGGPGFVAVGEEDIDGDINGAVWTSEDGKEWERVVDPEDAFAGLGEQHMYAVAAWDLGVGLVAAGTDVLEEGIDSLEPDGHWDAAVWTSVDGEHWIRLPGNDPTMSTLADLGQQEIKALLPIEGGFLALGAEAESGSDWDARVWIGTRVPS